MIGIDDRRFRLAAAFCVALGGVVAAAPFAANAQQSQPLPTAVTVVTLSAQDVPLSTRLPGRVVAKGVAEVRPQVNGIIAERLFEEGAAVEVGDPLYQIDSATYEARVTAAKAQVTLAEAEYRAAAREAERSQALVRRQVASERTFDEAIAARDTAAASVQVAKAELLSTQIDLQRTTVRAPLSGVIGRSLTTQGALVTSGQLVPLAVIRSLDPVLVDVTQSAADLVAWRRNLATTGEAMPMDDMGGEAGGSARLVLADGSLYGPTGALTAAEPHVDRTTGVVTLRLEFPNPQQLLLPGMYVQVELPQGVAHDAILAPQEGVARDRRGEPTALVANADNVVELRQLTVLGTRDANWIVTEGLAPGDRLIVAGLQKIAPGAKVTPMERQAEDGGAAGGAQTGGAQTGADARRPVESTAPEVKALDAPQDDAATGAANSDAGADADADADTGANAAPASSSSAAGASRTPPAPRTRPANRTGETAGGT